MGKYNDVPSQYRPISMWGYFGYEILFSIPVIGLIFLIVFACGATGNENVKNFARSYFCVLILYIVIILVGVAILLATGSMEYLIDALSNFY